MSPTDNGLLRGAGHRLRYSAKEDLFTDSPPSIRSIIQIILDRTLSDRAKRPQRIKQSGKSPHGLLPDHPIVSKACRRMLWR